VLIGSGIAGAWLGIIKMSLDLAIVGAVVGFLVSSVVWLVRRSFDAMAAAKADFVRRGYKVDFQIGTVLIDMTSKVIAFPDLYNSKYELYAHQDILGWEHQWEDRVTAVTNVWGTAVNGRTTQGKNVLVFKTNNPSKPLYKIPIVNHKSGEMHMARLNAIFNG
jgi:hypothetical protein